MIRDISMPQRHMASATRATCAARRPAKNARTDMHNNEYVCQQKAKHIVTAMPRERDSRQQEAPHVCVARAAMATPAAQIRDMQPREATAPEHCGGVCCEPGQ